MKKDYTKPQMQVMNIQQSKMLCGSQGASNVVDPGNEGFQMTNGGVFDDDDDDV